MFLKNDVSCNRIYDLNYYMFKEMHKTIDSEY